MLPHDTEKPAYFDIAGGAALALACIVLSLFFWTTALVAIAGVTLGTGATLSIVAAISRLTDAIKQQTEVISRHDQAADKPL